MQWFKVQSPLSTNTSAMSLSGDSKKNGAILHQLELWLFMAPHLRKLGGFLFSLINPPARPCGRLFP